MFYDSMLLGMNVEKAISFSSEIIPESISSQIMAEKKSYHCQYSAALLSFLFSTNCPYHLPQTFTSLQAAAKFSFSFLLLKNRFQFCRHPGHSEGRTIRFSSLFKAAAFVCLFFFSIHGWSIIISVSDTWLLLFSDINFHFLANFVYFFSFFFSKSVYLINEHPKNLSKTSMCKKKLLPP